MEFEERYRAFVNDVKDIRAKQDEIDRKIVELIAERYACRDETMPLKIKHDIPIEVGLRVDEVLDQIAEKAKDTLAPEELVKDIFKTILNYSMTYEEKYREVLTQKPKEKELVK